MTLSRAVQVGGPSGGRHHHVDGGNFASATLLAVGQKGKLMSGLFIANCRQRRHRLMYQLPEVWTSQPGIDIDDADSGRFPAI